jgi:predicted nucleic acid-binding protein
MNAKYFLDTNLLVYAFDQKESQKQAIARRYLNALFTQESHVLSLQVLNEFVSVAQRKLEPPMTPED